MPRVLFLWRNKRGNLKICASKWKWKHNLPGTLEYCNDRRSQINNLIMHLNVLRGKKEQCKLQSSKWREMRNTREEMNKTVTKIAIHRVCQTKKSCFKEAIGKSHPFYRSLFTIYSCASRRPLGLLFLSLRSIFANCTYSMLIRDEFSGGFWVWECLECLNGETGLTVLTPFSCFHYRLDKWAVKVIAAFP